MVTTVRHHYMMHTTHPTGPRCILAGDLVSAEAIRNTAVRQAGRTVLEWAQLLRDEDPRKVQRRISRCGREELETLMILALAAIPEDTTERAAYSWAVASC